MVLSGSGLRQCFSHQCSNFLKYQLRYKIKTQDRLSRIQYILTCVILGDGEGELRPTHIIPVTVILSEVYLKPGEKIENITVWVWISETAYTQYTVFVSSYDPHYIRAVLPGFRWSCVDKNFSKGDWGGNGEQLSLRGVHTWRNIPPSTIQCPGGHAVAKMTKRTSMIHNDLEFAMRIQLKVYVSMNIHQIHTWLAEHGYPSEVRLLPCLWWDSKHGYAGGMEPHSMNLCRLP